MELLTPQQRESIRLIREHMCCSLCGGVFDDPQRLDCKHNFCRSCIFTYLHEQRESTCPKCRLPIVPSEVTRNQFLQSMLVAWKNVETELKGLGGGDNGDGATVVGIAADEEEKPMEIEPFVSPHPRGPVRSSKWSVNTHSIRAQAESTHRRSASNWEETLERRAQAKNADLERLHQGENGNGSVDTSAWVPAPAPVPASATPVRRAWSSSSNGSSTADEREPRRSLFSSSTPTPNTRRRTRSQRALERGDSMQSSFFSPKSRQRTADAGDHAVENGKSERSSFLESSNGHQTVDARHESTGNTQQMSQSSTISVHRTPEQKRNRDGDSQILLHFLSRNDSQSSRTPSQDKEQSSIRLSNSIDDASSILSSPLSVMPTQEVEQFIRRIEAQKEFIDEWEEKTTAVLDAPQTRVVPVISAMEHMRGMLDTVSALRSSPGSKRKRSEDDFEREAKAKEEKKEEDVAMESDGEKELHAEDSVPTQMPEECPSEKTEAEETIMNTDEAVKDHAEDSVPTQMSGGATESPDLLDLDVLSRPTSNLKGDEQVVADAAGFVEELKQDLLPVDNSYDHDEERQRNVTSEVENELDDRKRDIIMIGDEESKDSTEDSIRTQVTQAPVSEKGVAIEAATLCEEVEDSQFRASDPSVKESVESVRAKKRRSEDFKGVITAFHANRVHKLSGGLEDLSKTESKAVSVNGSRGIAMNQAKPSPSTKPVVSVTLIPIPKLTATPVARPMTPTTTATPASRPPTPLCRFAFVGTDLTRDESRVVLLACRRLGGRYGREFDLRMDSKTGALFTSVTHLISKSVIPDPEADSYASSSASSNRTPVLRCKRTAKYMRALAEGTYVVDFSWVEASLQAGKWLPEEPYEMIGDMYSNSIGKPRESRLRRKRTGRRNDIFNMFRFVMLGEPDEFDFQIDSFCGILGHFGGNVMLAPDYVPMRHDAKSNTSRTPIGIVSKVLEPRDAKVLWTQFQIPIVRVTWIFDSISHLEVLPFDDYYPY